MLYQVPHAILDKTFARFRSCGSGARECQILWTSRWNNLPLVDRCIHPSHAAHAGGFEVDGDWLGWLADELAATRSGVRVQVHTHPGAAFHSEIDDAFPAVHTAGFLSLVIPRFATGSVGMDGAYLAELQADGSWREVDIAAHLVFA
jgi:hypothetical protein